MKYLSLLVFTAGGVTLGVELSAARLLDPWFGNSQIVWAGLIGMILLYLAIGAWLGGKLADRHPSLDKLLLVTSLGGLGVAFTPVISPPILRLAGLGFSDYAAGLLIGSLAAILALFSLPVILLGAVSPWAVRLAVKDLAATGSTAG
ncbi:MAG: spermine synthase, partial [Caldilineae bacterium]